MNKATKWMRRMAKADHTKSRNGTAPPLEFPNTQVFRDCKHFICLDPRKEKRDLVSAVLSPLGKIRWIPIPSVSFRYWPETKQRAEQAFDTATKQPRTKFTQAAKRLLLMMQYNWSRKVFSAQPKAIAVCWNGLNGTRRAFMDGARDAGARRLFFELAPLPGRFTIDPCGVNYLNSLPRDIAIYKTWHALSVHQSDSWRKTRKKISQRPSTRSPVYKNPKAPPLTDPFLFVPLQVPGDSQLRVFGGNFSTVEAFVSALCKAAVHLPTGWYLRIKEHPSAPDSFVASLPGLSDGRLVLDNVTDTFVQVAASRGVVTVNSSVGLEAMFFDKPVIATGQCFWAIDGVAVNARTVEELILYFSDPTSIVFHSASRDAFMSYLTQKYYPSIPKTSSLQSVFDMIEERLRGPDANGFWSCYVPKTRV